MLSDSETKGLSQTVGERVIRKILELYSGREQDSEIAGLQCKGRLCGHKGLAHTNTPDPGETADKWRHKRSPGQLLSSHCTGPEGKKPQPESKEISLALRPGQAGLRGTASRSGAAACPFCTAHSHPGVRGLEGKGFHLGTVPGTKLQVSFEILCIPSL